MNPKTRTLLLIGAFVTLSLGSFIWFIASWDPSKEEPVVLIPSVYSSMPA